jgi:hypothetical protein
MSPDHQASKKTEASACAVIPSSLPPSMGRQQRGNGCRATDCENSFVQQQKAAEGEFARFASLPGSRRKATRIARIVEAS